METTERYRYALARPNPTPETSLLNVPLSRRNHQNESLQDSLDSWTSRSRLGEPEALPVEAAPQGDDTKPKWSFWRKNTADKPLVTSGGGMLEAKSMSSSPAPVLADRRPSNTRSVSESAPAQSSRPASPSPSAIAAVNESPIVQPLAVAPEAMAAPAQSAVTRFFGRLSRRPTSQPAPDDDDHKDMALSADDFSFLDQVPSIAPPTQDRNVGELLGIEGGRPESLASLESMLNSKATPLPAPLAPPPAWARSNTSGSSSSRPREMDFLEGLDFDTNAGASSSLATQAAQPASSVASTTDWDQLLTSSAYKSTPTSAAPMLSSDSPLRPFTPPMTPSALSPPTSMRPQPTLSSPAAGHSYRALALQHPPDPAATTDFDDFADFAPAPAPTSLTKPDDFDDFGDFGDFSTPPPVSQTDAYSTPIHATSSLKAPPSTGHAKRASLDHSLTLNLINDASAVKGKRWPAPPSPLAPQLDPPPKASSATTSFPFISPPPGSRPSSGFGDLLDDGAKTTIANSSSLASRIQTPPAAPSVAMAPTRTASPLARPSSNALPANAAAAKSAQPGQSGLSAQDLSFFDSL